MPINRVRASAVFLVGAAIGLSALSRPASAQVFAELSGEWTLDREASQFPREIGFDATFFPARGGDASSAVRGQGSRGGRGSSGGDSGGAVAPQAIAPRGESYDDGRRRQQLTDEVRNPPARLTIVETPDSVTVGDDKGNARTFHPDGRTDTLEVGGVSLLTVARRESGKLVVLYAVEDLRQLRYTYSRQDASSPLTVDVEFLERNRPGDTVRRVYKTAVPAAPPSTGDGAPATSSKPEAGGAPRTVVPRAGSEFSGLKQIGVVVEDLTPQAVACGLKQDVIEAAVEKRFTDAGLKVLRNSDEDTYMYVNVMTSSLPSGMCISRYDWNLYSSADATLSHQHSPLLVQVLLAHKGGLTGSVPATHAADVLRGIDDGLAQITSIIHDANK